ncbi:MAG: holo-[acyl-carrier-protein] synthase [Desulfonatronovibrionaceae bacterium]
MILGIGIDIVENRRISRSWERFGNRFAEKILAPGELESGKKPSAEFLASRFAVKEAAVKALGTGFSAGISCREIEISTTPSGKPVLRLHGRAGDAFRALGASTAHVSISHGRDSSVAVVIVEKD